MRIHRSSTLRRLWRIALAGAPALGCSAGSSPAPADEQAVERLRLLFAEEIAFELTPPLYVRARLRPGAAVAQAELERVYIAFFFSPDGRRRDTRFVYLNVYDPGGRFLFQLAYDPQRGAIVRSETEFYE